MIIIVIVIILIIITKKVFTNNEWWADPGLSLTKVLWLWTNFQMQMAQTTVYQEYVYCQRDPCRGIVHYLSSLLN